MPSLFARGHRAVYLPVPTSAGYADDATPEREAARRELGIAAGEILACRVARPDVRKWSVRLELALPGLFRAIPELRFAFMAAPESKLEPMKRRFGERVIGLAADADLGAVARVYAASDFMIHSSGIGESFGLSVAEAMYHGLPVVVDSTPDMDNAQVELVDHEGTGLVVGSSAGFVEAASRLARDPALRERLGAAARARAGAAFADTVVVRRWHAIYAESCRHANVPLPAGEPSRDATASEAEDESVYAAFESEYARRVESIGGPASTLGERGMEAMIRARDMLAHARALGPRTVWRVVRSRLSASGSLARD
jgi:hypothetical protein